MDFQRGGILRHRARHRTGSRKRKRRSRSGSKHRIHALGRGAGRHDDKNGHSVTYVKPTASIQAAPELLEEVGQTSTLTWVFSNADTCFVDQGIGEVEPGGEHRGQPDANHHLHHHRRGSGRNRERLRHRGLRPARNRFLRHPGNSRRRPDGDPVLDRPKTRTTAPSIKASAKCRRKAKRSSIRNKQTTYVLSAEGPGGRVSESVTVTCMAPEVEISVEPGSIEEGRPATLTWRVDHAAETNSSSPP